MNDEGSSFRVLDSSFNHRFEIHKFKESPIIPESSTLYGMGNIVSLTVQGKGERPENKDFVVFRFSKYFGTEWLKRSNESAPDFLSCTCIFCILDVEEEMQFPRTLTFEGDLEYLYEYENKYIKRSCILDNASEYLKGGTLTVVVQGTVKEWTDWYKLPSRPFLEHATDHFYFDAEELEHDLKVYLRRNSMYARVLLIHSSVFRKMWKVPMREGKEKRLLLRNEELPAFLNMLLSFEAIDQTVLYENVLSDLYKISLMYDVKVVLEKCRECIEKYLPKSASVILEFATFYGDKDLKRTAESYVERSKTQESNDDLEMGCKLDDDFVCDIRPVSSNLINTRADFEEYLGNLSEKLVRNAYRAIVRCFQRSEIKPPRETFDFYQ